MIPTQMNHWMRAGFAVIAGVTCLTLAPIACAFPPAPHHLLFGLVRNQWGDPINVTGAEVFLQTSNGVGSVVAVAPATGTGVNYRMSVPMDSGTTPDPYQAAALRREQPFQLKVQIGRTTYLPIEMVLGSRQVGDPALSTRLDLTLGEDSDGDGLPDAWEQAIIALLGGTLASITPDGDADGDGISNRDEYLAGTFAFDPTDGFSLTLTGFRGNDSVLSFMAVRGRTYKIEASADLQRWTPVSFHVLAGGNPGALVGNYQATKLEFLQVVVPGPAGGEASRYFKAVVQ